MELPISTAILYVGLLGVCNSVWEGNKELCHDKNVTNSREGFSCYFEFSMSLVYSGHVFTGLVKKK